MFQSPFSFEGRIRRIEYGISIIVYLFTMVLTNSLILRGGIATIFAILWIPLHWFLLAQGAKRCHDLGKRGLYQLIPFYVFWMLFTPGEHKINEFGANPKGLRN
jgi:uncharacterized membrane protein YhaH (DUF805 family)